MALRATWKGSLTLSLINIPIRVFAATTDTADVFVPGRLLAMKTQQMPTIHTPELNDDDESSVTRESTRGGQEPAPEDNDRPDQNVAYDEVVKGATLTEAERRRAERESPLAAPLPSGRVSPGTVRET